MDMGVGEWWAAVEREHAPSIDDVWDSVKPEEAKDRGHWTYLVALLIVKALHDHAEDGQNLPIDDESLCWDLVDSFSGILETHLGCLPADVPDPQPETGVA